MKFNSQPCTAGLVLGWQGNRLIERHPGQRSLVTLVTLWVSIVVAHGLQDEGLMWLIAMWYICMHEYLCHCITRCQTMLISCIVDVILSDLFSLLHAKVWPTEW